MSIETLLVHWQWKGIVLLLMAWGFYFLLRRQTAQKRFFFLMCVFISLLCIPLIEQIFIQLPYTPVQQMNEAGAKWMERTFDFEIDAGTLETTFASKERVNASGQSADPNADYLTQNKTSIFSAMPSIRRWDIVWFVGLLCLMTRSGWHYFTLIRIRNASRIISDLESNELLKKTRSKLSIKKKVTLIETSLLSVPATWGWLRPVIALPVQAKDWSRESLQTVLEHECVHIKRSDFLSLQFGTFVRALTWWNPMSWWLFKHLRSDMEMSCDEQVLSTGVSPTSYAQALLNIAKSASGSTLSSAVLMASKPNVQRRIEAVLNKRTLRSQKAILHWIPLMSMLLLAVLLGSQTTLPETEKLKTSLIDDPDPEFEKRLKDFFQLRYERTKSYIAEKNLDLPEDSDHLRFFQLGLNGSWREALTLARQLVDKYNNDFQSSSSDEPVNEFTLVHETVLEHPFTECLQLLETCEDWNLEQIEYFIQHTLETLPNKSILFWDSKTGGILLSLYTDTLAESKEMVTFNQNSIADSRYFEYLQIIYNQKISIPSESDVQSAYITYMGDAAKRYHADTLYTGETVNVHPDGRIAVQGRVAVTGVGSHLIEWMASKNSDWTIFFAGSAMNPFIQYNLMNGGLVTLYLYGAKQSNDHKKVNMEFTKTKVETVFQHLVGIRADREVCLEFVQRHFLHSKAAGSPSNNIPHESVRNAWANLILSQCKAIQSLSPSITPEETQEVLDPLFLQAWTLCPQNEEVVDAYIDYLELSNQSEWKETISKLVPETLFRQASE